ncbi:beta-L-arabinofuranosidase domain-containing protein [Nonomuraea rubra]|uniref:beta-L-arabinofuranosidase domain-containing protein n=1 Tax=Nonomuraea rubra TaxID=46180 RepID=UPI003CD09CF5
MATGHGRYADLIERTLYNAFAASTSAERHPLFYVNPLQRRADLFETPTWAGRRSGSPARAARRNIMRLVSSLGHYVATTAGD